MAATHDYQHGHHTPVLEHAHPTARVYVTVAAILTFLTAIEVAVFYVIPQSVRPLLMLALAVLALFKFSLVVAFYMHLKFDARLLTWLFVGGLVTATAVITGLWALFNGWGG
ncbi:MAG TPA: cytochrome C oxidase subunit IV family protein [Chloroflexota bacterium]|jgi:cytochrome c oxidase subunit 4|nr:cytochrome C oxidase subunit IV family protein [Chloroflexota bacterium]